MSTCGTCAFAVFQHTPTGRIAAKKAGRCTRGPTEINVLACETVKVWRSYIWISSGEGCSGYQCEPPKILTAK